MVAASLLLASLLAFASANPVKPSFVLHESREDIPDGFTLKGAASPDTQLTLRLGLIPNNIDGLHQALYAVSTPSSAQYGQYLTQAEVDAFVSPTTETTDAVTEWLAANDLTAKSTSVSGDWYSITVPVSRANELFNTEFQVFTHTESGKDYVRTLAYSIATSLQGSLDLVHPTITFPNPSGGLPVVSSPVKARDLAEHAPASCATAVTPACLQALYGIPTAKATQLTNNLGVTGFIEQFAQTADLTAFLKAFRPDLPSSTTFTLQTLDGGSNPQGPTHAGLEANLDIQYTVGLASGVPVTFISVGENNQDGDLGGFLDIVNFLISQSAPPQVLTTSYGQNENTISRSLANSLCNAYAQLGARGTSVLFASGDGGVSGSQAEKCTTFVPTFPSGCPFVTSVGATTGISPEVAAELSAGGFSNYFSQPSYQSAAVSSYINTVGVIDTGKFNRSGRGYPDVSAQGEHVEIFNAGTQGAVDGTSCSSPIFASVISLLNDELTAAGRAPMGFLNPFLYDNPGALNDIDVGSNPGCNTIGFPAAFGWDPVTGLGTPNYRKLRAAVGL